MLFIWHYDSISPDRIFFYFLIEQVCLKDISKLAHKQKFNKNKTQYGIEAWQDAFGIESHEIKVKQYQVAQKFLISKSISIRCLKEKWLN